MCIAVFIELHVCLHKIISFVPLKFLAFFLPPTNIFYDVVDLYSRHMNVKWAVGVLGQTSTILPIEMTQNRLLVKLFILQN